MSSSNSATARGAEGWGYENEGCAGGDRGAGGGRRGTTLTVEWTYLSAHPLFSILICKCAVNV